MTADDLQKIALRLAGASFVRLWLQWSPPGQTPWLMALQVLGSELRPLEVQVFEKYGLTWDADDGRYYAERTHEDGTPYRSEL